ncbi:hypothetical protein GCM10007079_11990 [Nocardiopsis terrae]|uniref:Uncharacterized protein n=1 Tax=Nocardiopsis terrae TaxID=372655 RepID=A0ABR9HC44_9ACTN|nr:hypothetical protein [Nocardiopsis terrae]MBE1456591.1 hypothetical protein [Nocardiopsis terrae]GHC76050.1 hypothetical protein GCM10007079_11990 [Nocardiopsis terrae]
MRDGIPLVYRTFRNSWTVLHVLLVLAGAGALVWWWTEGNLVLLLTAFADTLLAIQNAVGGLVRWPWSRW